MIDFCLVSVMDADFDVEAALLGPDVGAGGFLLPLSQSASRCLAGHRLHHLHHAVQRQWASDVRGLCLAEQVSHILFLFSFALHG